MAAWRFSAIGCKHGACETRAERGVVTLGAGAGRCSGPAAAESGTKIVLGRTRRSCPRLRYKQLHTCFPRRLRRGDVCYGVQISRQAGEAVSQMRRPSTKRGRAAAPRGSTYQISKKVENCLPAAIDGGESHAGQPTVMSTPSSRWLPVELLQSVDALAAIDMAVHVALVPHVHHSLIDRPELFPATV